MSLQSPYQSKNPLASDKLAMNPKAANYRFMIF